MLKAAARISSACYAIARFFLYSSSTARLSSVHTAIARPPPSIRSHATRPRAVRLTTAAYPTTARPPDARLSSKCTATARTTLVFPPLLVLLPTVLPPLVPPAARLSIVRPLGDAISTPW